MGSNPYLDHLINTPNEDIDLDALPQFDERNASGEFDGMTNDEIILRYVQEAIDDQENDELQEIYDEMDDD